MAEPATLDCDVAVVGAGPAGSACAHWLARAGCRVLLIERSRFDAPRVGESLAPAVQPLLRELGVWERFAALHPWPSWGTRSLWGAEEEQSHSHMVSAWGCGWHVDRLAFDRMLADAAVSAGACRLDGTAVQACEAGPGGWRLSLAATPGTTRPRTAGRWPVARRAAAHAGPRQLTAAVLVDATGRSASLARRLGAQRLLFDRLVGVAAQWSRAENGTPSRPRPPQQVVTVETVPLGWWYSAPLPGSARVSAATRGEVVDHGMVGMLFTDADLCGRHDLASLARWQAGLADAPLTSERLAGRSLRWGPCPCSAVSQRLRRRERQAPWLAVGDAALAVDPISGSGVVRALRTAKAASGAALGLLATGADTARPSAALEAYEAELDSECTRYLRERALYYGLEQRWQAAEFWQRRGLRQPAGRGAEA
ncbi:NAD(P)/FAD-dependent oxidoreductase [Aquabacterium sp. A7-Y]|uniref:FAD-dependent oxidoreductase n=1 Tax=Aquabacterium sp. A7-Y TaxID=1349605 RepID=UPI00223E0984|nr:FAD-dependent oxidoreductase [Aquabacterium sp. A7-Y]MCW7541728.1 NAD(P)/FAD-dependent oxidoreductase [Aquabacterium sp. A7-Y]